LFIDGDILYSAESTTQGDSSAMIMYAIGILPLIHRLDLISVSQLWFADDAAAIGNIKSVHHW
jgi:hypothetical protein